MKIFCSFLRYDQHLCLFVFQFWYGCWFFTHLFKLQVWCKNTNVQCLFFHRHFVNDYWVEKCHSIFAEISFVYYDLVCCSWFNWCLDIYSILENFNGRCRYHDGDVADDIGAGCGQWCVSFDWFFDFSVYTLCTSTIHLEIRYVQKLKNWNVVNCVTILDCTYR